MQPLPFTALSLVLVSLCSMPAMAVTDVYPANVLAQAEGDLDKDGIPEKVIVLDTGLMGDMGSQRAVLIYKQQAEGWALWHYGAGGILPSDHGGMMGDPFDSLSIERGAIVIKHFGGSSQKWHYTHRFRYQDANFHLIGATIDYGYLSCNYTSFDFNLAAGKANYHKIDEGCDEQEQAKPTISHALTLPKSRLPNNTLPTLDGFYPGNTELVLSEIGESIYY